MNISIGPASIAQTTMLTGVIVIILGLLVWFANGLIQVTFSRWMKVRLLSSAQAGRSIAILGALVLAAGILASAWPVRSGASPSPASPAAPPAAVPSVVPSAGTAPPAAATARASVRITTPDGTTALGRDIIAAGTVGAAKSACYAVGWYVQTAADWTAYFLATAAHPGADGSFRTPVLQLGSPGETGSSWFPFLIGATPAGCAWLEQLWAQTPTGEYHGAWPPPNSTILYSSRTAIHRMF